MKKEIMKMKIMKANQYNEMKKIMRNNQWKWKIIMKIINKEK